MSEVVIQVDNLSKKYQTGTFHSQTFVGEFNRWIAKTLNRPDPLIKIDSNKLDFDKGEHWALQDVSFEIKRGDAVGIIGKNGAGKSTLLKILSRVTSPTSGHIHIKGRVASLLEVGTGFHPELTGRENIFLNGAILGMAKSEIASKLDEIIDFSGVEKYIDTPVKRYSSGMYVRLAFAVAAYLEPDILIVDEVLAVGDAEFQKKCIGKINEANNKDGRTVLFVSHNMNAVSKLTVNSMLLQNGKVIEYGKSTKVIDKYYLLNINENQKFSIGIDESKNAITFVEVITSNKGGIHISGKKIEFKIHIHLTRKILNGAVSLQIFNQMDIPVVHTWTFDTENNIFNKKGVISLTCNIPNLKLYLGRYYCKIIVAENNGNIILDTLNNICHFEVLMLEHERAYKWEEGACIYLEEFEWRT
ncbi:MAG: ABC transporter ATP-binding protein [Bacteroidota bacterium]|nr:ABC transporter ATP-binding protein [Bacteroidota bacterium]